MRAPPPRITNLALLVALLIAFASGVGAVAAGTASGRWVAIGHGIVGVASAPGSSGWRWCCWSPGSR